MEIKETYEAPQVEVIQVEVEKGFATSLDLDINDWGTEEWSIIYLLSL